MISQDLLRSMFVFLQTLNFQRQAALILDVCMAPNMKATFGQQTLMTKMYLVRCVEQHTLQQ